MSLKNECKQAENILAARGKRITAIASEVAKLTEHLGALQAADASFQDAQALEAVGEATAGAVQKARARVESVKADIDALSSRLAGLRRQTASYGPELAQYHRALAGEIPERNRALTESFVSEWTAAVEQFSQMLSKRAAVEQLLGKKLTLPNPTATQFDLREVRRPDELLQELGEAVANCGASAPLDTYDPGNVLATYIPGKLYVLAVDFKDQSGPQLSAGSLVCESSFEDHWLQHLVGIRYAVPVVPSFKQNAINAATAMSIAQKRAATEASQQAVSPFLDVR